MRKLRSLAVLVSVAAVGIAMTGMTSANAEGSGSKVNAYQQLRLERFGDGTFIGWQKVADSPLDTNSRALATHVATDPDTSDGNYYYADAYTRSSIHLNKAVGSVRNLSFDYRTGQAGAGAPRISVLFANGDVAYASAEYCAQPIAVSGGSWTRADFTGSNTSTSAPCEIWVTGTTTSSSGHYDSDATHSAWANYALAHPSQVVTETFLVWDVVGDYTIDRIALGTGFMFNNDNTHAVKCNVEAAC